MYRLLIDRRTIALALLLGASNPVVAQTSPAPVTPTAPVASTFAARPVCSLENERSAELPIPPDRIKLVRGAGNYAELEAAERTLLLRATLSQVEALLAAHGFVRISRSIIIPKRRIAAMEMRGGRRVVRLIDGSEHRVGSTFSAQLRLAGIGPS